MTGVTIELENRITNMIFSFRGIKVMLDRDLAELYGVSTENLNLLLQSVIERLRAVI